MKKLVAVFVLLLVIAGLAVAGAEILRPYRGYAGKVIVEIPPGMRAPQVADLLAAKGILAQRWPFLLLYGVGRWRYHLQAGAYLFDRPLRPLDVYRKLARGQVYFRSVVIPEGSNRFDIARILHERLDIPVKDFLQASQNPAAIRDLDPQAPSLEGYLFPDTYQFEYHTSAAHVVRIMLGQFRRVFKRDIEQDLSESGLSLHQVMTLASLVETETPDPAERPIIAQVFELRLKKGMLLQCDPTVLYAADLDHHPIDTITESDLQIQSPYNTYLHAGLPPGPIANPGLASIRAVLHPASTHYLYFVSNNHGGHAFARTLAGHLRNVARYREEVAGLRRSVPDAAKGRKHRK
ncbi:MAG: endolytic transglycosylase MltG [Acidobacteria bacterium]|nr:endolytic transglycosylase MltG [Acidobacteriota bacterium]